jgi:hypothetical protein
MYANCVKWNQFCEGLSNDSYNIKKIIGKNINDKNILATLKKTLILFKMWNFKTLKIQRMFQNCFKFS